MISPSLLLPRRRLHPSFPQNETFDSVPYLVHSLLDYGYFMRPGLRLPQNPSLHLVLYFIPTILSATFPVFLEFSKVFGNHYLFSTLPKQFLFEIGQVSCLHASAFSPLGKEKNGNCYYLDENPPYLSSTFALKTLLRNPPKILFSSFLLCAMFLIPHVFFPRKFKHCI